MADALALNFELDHVFILSSVDAAEARVLLDHGLSEVAPNRHPGHGTACRRFGFRDTYLELAWVCDPDEAQRAAIRPTQLWDRWVDRQGAACPFGIVLRPRQSADVAAPPFPAWEYQPPYLPPPLVIHVARDVPLHEPAFFYFGARPTRQPWQEPAAADVRPAVTRVTIGTPETPRPAAAAVVQSADWFRIEPSDQYVMRIGLDGGGVPGTHADLRPALPVVLEW